MSSKTVSFQYELLVDARGSFCTDLCSLESVQALSQPCPLLQLPNFGHIIEVVTSSPLHQDKRNIQEF